MNIIGFLQKQTKARIILIAAASMAAVAALDFFTGTEVSFSIFYLIPVAMLTWFCGKRSGLSGAAACTILWFVVDRLSGREYSHGLIPVWNAIVRGGFFVIVSLVLSRMRGVYQLEKSVAELKSHMLSVVSHEFGNSLTVSKMATLLLKEEDGKDASARRLSLYAMLDRVQSDLEGVVANFLNHARMESGRFDLHLDTVILRTVIDSAITSIRPLMERKGIEFQMDFPVLPIEVRADRDALALIMSNLLGNAIKYTPKGGRICVGITAELARGALPGKAVIWVEDSGIGMSPEERRKITAGFFRADEAQKVATGFGIGLKITRELIQAHGGELELDSEQGKGTKASFRLPIARDRSLTAT